jgi:hypothetical protein
LFTFFTAWLAPIYPYTCQIHPIKPDCQFWAQGLPQLDACDAISVEIYFATIFRPCFKIVRLSDQRFKGARLCPHMSPPTHVATLPIPRPVGASFYWYVTQLAEIQCTTKSFFVLLTLLLVLYIAIMDLIITVVIGELKSVNTQLIRPE